MMKLLKKSNKSSPALNFWEELLSKLAIEHIKVLIDKK